MNRKALGVLLGSVVAILGTVAATKTTPATYTCSLTGKTVEKCCCVEQKDGKLFCTLAQKTVDSCCCRENKK